MGNTCLMASMVQVYPQFCLRLGIQPDGVAEGLCQEFQAIDAGTVLPLIRVNGSVGVRQFMGRHAGIAHHDQPRFGIATGQVLDRFGL